MADRLDDMLEPGERVVFRLPPPKGVWLRLLAPLAVATVLVLAVKYVVPFVLGEDGTIRMGLAFGVILVLLPIFLVRNLSTDAAVTEKRLLVWAGSKPAAPTVVKLDEVERVEILRGGLRVLRRDRPPILLVRSQGLPKLATALAGAAGLRPSRGPLPRESAADRFMLLGFLAGGLLPGMACLTVLENLVRHGTSGVGLLPVVAASLAVIPAFFLLGLLTGLLTIRLRFTRAEMRGWIEGSAHYAQAVADGGLSERLSRRILALALRLYGPPSTPDNTGAERHGG